jgi:oligoribonuclease NrnB/cAMP/cGMP phosphodiesterase (DHH superfamily)
MRVIICSHEADIDGMYSASVALIKYPSAHVSFYNYGLDNFKRMFDYLKGEARNAVDGLVIISDLGINDESVSQLCVDTIRYVKTRGWSIIWVDHHPWHGQSLASIRKLIKLYHDPTGKKCATEIMHDRLMNKSKIARQLKLIAHISDFMTDVKNHDSRVSELIHFYRNGSRSRQKLESLVRKASIGVLWDHEMQLDYIKFAKLSGFQKSKSLNTLIIKKVNSFNVAFVFTYPLVQASLFASEIFSKMKIDLVMLFNKEGKVSIRRNTNKISCNGVASFLVEGGGHEFASGGRLESDPRNLNACIKEMQTAIKRSLT